MTFETLVVKLAIAASNLNLQSQQPTLVAFLVNVSTAVVANAVDLGFQYLQAYSTVFR